MWGSTLASPYAGHLSIQGPVNSLKINVAGLVRGENPVVRGGGGYSVIPEFGSLVSFGY
jgi:hypothetical protein